MTNFTRWNRHPAYKAVELLNIHSIIVVSFSILITTRAIFIFYFFSSPLADNVHVIVWHISSGKTFASSSTLRTHTERSFNINSFSLTFEGWYTLWSLLVVQIIVLNHLTVSIVTMKKLCLANTGQESAVRCCWKVTVGRLASKKNTVQIRLGTTRHFRHRDTTWSF